MSEPESRIAEILKNHLGESVRLERLPGDASDRAFYRVSRADSGTTAILMTQETGFNPPTFPFCQMQEFLARIGIPVPTLELVLPEEGWILMADCGKTTLQEYLCLQPGTNLEEPYRQAVDLLVVLQDRGARELPAHYAAAQTRLDRRKLSEELRFTWQHLFRSLWNRDLSADDDTTLNGWADDIAVRLEGMDPVLCHRDYHSRNLLWDGSRLAVVDFQDSRLGPVTYDLASLLDDPYLAVPEDLKEEMFWRFLEGKGWGLERERQLREELDLAVVQRCLKAAGTYAYQAGVRNRTEYLPYLPIALGNALRALRRFTEYASVLRILEKLET